MYDKCPVDLLVGRDCDNFRTLLFKAEDFKEVFALTRNQQHKDEDEETNISNLERIQHHYWTY